MVNICKVDLMIWWHRSIALTFNPADKHTDRASVVNRHDNTKTMRSSKQNWDTYRYSLLCNSWTSSSSRASSVSSPFNSWSPIFCCFRSTRPFKDLNKWIQRVMIGCVSLDTMHRAREHNSLLHLETSRQITCKRSPQIEVKVILNCLDSSFSQEDDFECSDFGT